MKIVHTLWWKKLNKIRWRDCMKGDKWEKGILNFLKIFFIKHKTICNLTVMEQLYVLG